MVSTKWILLLLGVISCASAQYTPDSPYPYPYRYAPMEMKPYSRDSPPRSMHPYRRKSSPLSSISEALNAVLPKAASAIDHLRRKAGEKGHAKREMRPYQSPVDALDSPAPNEPLFTLQCYKGTSSNNYDPRYGYKEEFGLSCYKEGKRIF